MKRTLLKLEYEFLESVSVKGHFYDCTIFGKIIFSSRKALTSRQPRSTQQNGRQNHPRPLNYPFSKIFFKFFKNVTNRRDLVKLVAF